MRIFVLAAAAALVASSASAGSVFSTITSVDATSRIVHLSDRTSMVMGPDVDIASLRPAMRVEIIANLDEDGFGPATRVIALD